MPERTPMAMLEAARAGAIVADGDPKTPTDQPGRRPRIPIRSVRWLMLLIFPGVYVVSQQSLGNLGWSFLLFTLANAAACGILLARLGGPLRRTLWAWLALLVLLDGHFVNMMLFTAHINSPQFINRYYSEVRWVTRTRILSSYPWVTLGFVSFCLSASVVISWQPAPKRWLAAIGPRRISVNYTQQLVLAAFVFYLAASYLEARLGYGVLGQANPSLPLHLGTVLTFGRDFLAIALFTLGIWVLDSARSQWTAVAIGLLVAAAIIDGFVSTSRGSLVTLLAPLLLMLLLTRRFTNNRRIGLLFIAIATLALFPIFSNLRTEKLSGQAATTSAPLLGSLVDSGTLVIGRVTGVDGVWYALDHRGNFSVPNTLSFLQPGKLADYYTHQVVEVPVANDFRSPGLIGGLMIVGGAPAVVLFTFLITVIFQLLWSTLLLLRCAPVALALGAITIGIFVMGGSLDFLSLLKVGLEATACELVYRRLLQRSASGVLVVG